ncbi:hypothetical protein [Rhizobium laguerreae]|uniref:hypothetical protein n=1 Tax=Rhizobium laguerreae TaxID=1076926 RepID=UPI001C922AAF|nr:hypothetical protein [Rhizobium laguerreae]MBY3247434.1 hypothetical protein [Rhizobium laguerreae]
MGIGIEDQPVFAIVAGLWAATNVVLVASQALNERRDTVLSGYIKDRQLSIKHRRLIMMNDWLPMTVATGIACVIFCGLLLASPAIFDLDLGKAVICYSLSSIPVIGAVSLLYGALHEYRLMNEVLAADDAKIAKASATECVSRAHSST